MTIETRPEPIILKRSQDLRRWYWLKSELIALARHLGIHTGGGKDELTERIAAKLDGKTLTRPTPPKPAAQPLSGPLSPTTVIPNGQRLTQALRDFFAAELGPDFRFDGHMRQFMAQGTGGKIINIASMLSFQGGVRVPSYTASKSGVMGITRLLANEWAQHGINVNAIAPGYMSTNNTAALREDAGRSAMILERIPAGRWGTPDDLAGPVVFLASRASDYVHGYTIAVDGGWLAR